MWDEEEYILRRPILHDEEEDKWYDEFTGHEIVLDGDYWWDTVDEEYLVDTEESDIFVFEQEQKEIAFEEAMSEMVCIEFDSVLCENNPHNDLLQCFYCETHGDENQSIRFYPKENVYKCPRCLTTYSRKEFFEAIGAEKYVEDCLTCNGKYPECGIACETRNMKRLFSK